MPVVRGDEAHLRGDSIVRWYRTVILLLCWLPVTLPFIEECFVSHTLAFATEEAAELIEIVRSDRPYSEKLRACRRLAEIGSPEAVPALAELLRQDENLSHAARLGLDAIPHPSAGQALIEALGDLDGPRRVGAVQSLGVRRESEAVKPLAELLRSSDVATATAAARALGRIATDAAVRELLEFLPEASESVRTGVGYALVEAGQQLAAEGKHAEAVRIFDTLANMPMPRPLNMAAVRGAVLYDSQHRAQRLLAILDDSDAAFQVALEAARWLPATDVARQVAPILGKVSPERQELLLELLSDLGEREVLPFVLPLAESTNQGVRIAAIRCLGQLGDVSVFTLLLQAAFEENAAVAKAARETLGQLPDPRVNAEIVSQLARRSQEAPQQELAILIELCGKRRLRESVPILLPLLDSADPKIRHPILRTLGEVGGPEELQALTARLLRPVVADDEVVLKEVVRLIAIRAADRDGVSRVLVQCLAQAPPDLKKYLIDVLGVVGTPTALEALRQLVWQPEYQDTVSRVLGQWMNPGAAPLLLELAAKAEDQRYRIRALRGFLRIARQFDISPTERLWMIVQSLKLAERDEERLLALQALGRLATTLGLKEPEGLSQRDGALEQAVALGFNLAENLSSHDPVRVRDSLLALATLTNDPDLRERAHQLAAKLAQ